MESSKSISHYQENKQYEKSEYLKLERENLELRRMVLICSGAVREVTGNNIVEFVRKRGDIKGLVIDERV